MVPGKRNTLYTYAFVIMEKYKSNGYAKMLKRVYKLGKKKREYKTYITGHVREGIANRFDNNIEIVNHIKDWHKLVNHLSIIEDLLKMN